MGMWQLGTWLRGGLGSGEQLDSVISEHFFNPNYSVILKLHEQPKLGEAEAVHCFCQLFFVSNYDSFKHTGGCMQHLSSTDNYFI